MTSRPPARAAIWRQNLEDEHDGIALYEGLAAVDDDPARSRTFRALADAERKHADVWRQKLEAAGMPHAPGATSGRVKLLLAMARLFGVKSVLPWVVLGESADVDKYRRQGGKSATALASDERAHLDTLRKMSGREPSAETIASEHARTRSASPSRERWHRASRSGSVRAAIFGMNDGIVSNVSLVLGVAAAGVEQGTVTLTGLAGLLAGAFSMGVGEYVSVASQRDLLRRQIEIERREIAEAPEEEEAELRALLREKGLTSEQAAEMAGRIMKNPEQALDMHVREELGLDPSDLGSPLSAAIASIAMFALGAAIPILPFLWTRGPSAPVQSATLSGAVLASVGALVGVLSGSGALRSAARMLGLAAIAALVTVAVGRLIGVSVA